MERERERERIIMKNTMFTLSQSCACDTKPDILFTVINNILKKAIVCA